MSNHEDSHALDTLMSYPIAATLAYFSVGILLLIVCLACFEWVTRYNCWAEIRKGNAAVAMATGGKIFGICNVFRYAIQAQNAIYESIGWAVLGFVLLLAGYFLFEFVTPVLRVDDEIAKDNRAVGLISFLVSVSLSFVIGASITFGD
ncbi:DUF350 domain-containing protein [Cohnella fermenti]|uniref:DUF350 domain-containing protein n=1 Tax=Cohnella fermenti TaxID=2565925 RepID=A0A4S4BMJ7_9BACL|nr:DUF350 domain-containing protein [Cohnella fermenti]THF76053.1 DUF350 domain-containing protein [Cohnella fermenti]